MNNKTDIHELETKILQTTSDIREQFPSAYKVLAETPLFLRVQDAKIRMNDLKDYLETIRCQLADLKAAKHI
jgi:hypothetical protein